MNVAIVDNCDYSVKDIISRSTVCNVSQAEQMLRRWIKTSTDVWFGMCDDKVACVWGLSPPSTISNRAYLWLLTTDLVEEHKFIFIRKSQLVIEEALKHYPIIVGHVDFQNRPAKRWLKWLGASIGECEETGYCQFIIRRADG